MLITSRVLTTVSLSTLETSTAGRIPPHFVIIRKTLHRWTITNGGSEPIKLSFADPFWLETGYTHCYDHLTIKDESSGERWDLCGDEVPGDLELQTDTITVTLFTDSYNNYDGFRMFYQSTGDATKPSHHQLHLPLHDLREPVRCRGVAV